MDLDATLALTASSILGVRAQGRQVFPVVFKKIKDRFGKDSAMPTRAHEIANLNPELFCACRGERSYARIPKPVSTGVENDETS